MTTNPWLPVAVTAAARSPGGSTGAAAEEPQPRPTIVPSARRANETSSPAASATYGDDDGAGTSPSPQYRSPQLTTRPSDRSATKWNSPPARAT
ncbi:hypothetical protein NSA53_18520 [Cellulosimicrobium cellulans]|nr:hypothetical protein [Cellulosimicrobium cellulans]